MTRLSLFNSPFLLGFDQFERTVDRISKLSSDSYPPYNIEQISNDTTEFLTEDESTKVAVFFPNVEIQDLNVLNNPDTNQITINFTYIVKNTNIQDEINISFT